jgi:hypothetical protein
MANTGTESVNPQEMKDNSVRRLIRTARMWEAITFVAVILISPISFIVGLPLGISPHDWLASWTRWTVVFIAIAIFISLLGFEIALSYRLKARRISTTGHS